MYGIGLKNFFGSIKYFRKKEFITELYVLHFTTTICVMLLVVPLLNRFAFLADTGLFMQCFISGLLAFTINAVREALKEHKSKNSYYKYKFDWIDVYFGTYGGILVPIYLLLISLL